jgi:hypothetical protein
MTRWAVLLSIVSLAAYTACDVGDASNGQNIGGTDGGVKMDGPGGSGSNMGSAAVCVNPGTPGTPHVHSSPVNAGNPSNTGLNCLGVGCHNAGGGGGQFQFGGTLYTTSGGTTAAGGATVRVWQGGQSFTALTDSQGNFYYAGPAITWGTDTTTDSSSCPSIMTMSTKLTIASNGGCNGCHAPGGTQSTIGLQ